MQYLLDTVVLVRHFVGKGKIGKKASGFSMGSKNPMINYSYRLSV